MNASEPYVLVDKTPPVALVTLNKPAKLNAFTVGDRNELFEALDALQADGEVRAVVLTGAGKGFCAGADITGQEFSFTAGADTREQFSTPRGAWIARIYGFEKPLIAAINGAAVGAGLSIALACDIRIASRGASLIPAWVDRALVPDAGASFFLTRMLGVARATELAMTGERIDAARALELGLVSRVVQPSALLAEALALANTIAEKPPISIAHIKRNMRLAAESPLAAQVLAESAAMASCLLSEDFQEALRAFKEKRPGIYKGR